MDTYNEPDFLDAPSDYEINWKNEAILAISFIGSITAIILLGLALMALYGA